MKKAVILLSALLLLFGISALAEGNIEIYIDGGKLYTEDEPVNTGSRVLVPMRAIFEALDASVDWDDSAKTVWAERDGQHIAVNTLDSSLSIYVYNTDNELYWVETVRLDAAPRIINDRTYVPVRAVSEALGAYVSWDGERERVIIDSRQEEDGTVYYASDSDFQHLYSVGKNGRDRRLLSKRQVERLEMYDGEVYYSDKNNHFIYCADKDGGEEAIVEQAVNKIGVDDGYVYYQELDSEGRKYGRLCRINVDTRAVQYLTEESVRYPEKYRDFIYYNVAGHNEMYAVSLDGKTHHTISIVGVDYSKLYPFNCIFFGDYILIENGSRFGNLTRVGLDGSDPRTLTMYNALIFRNQQYDDKIVYMQPEFGQDIYCMNTDGSDNHLVHKGDPKWIDIEILARWNDTIYYKHPMREEVYRVNLDGSGDEYTCYADDLQAKNGRIFASFNGLYTGKLDGSDQKYLYDRKIKGFALIDDKIFFKDASSSRLYMYDYSGRGGSVTFDAAGEWVECDD